MATYFNFKGNKELCRALIPTANKYSIFTKAQLDISGLNSIKTRKVLSDGSIVEVEVGKLSGGYGNYGTSITIDTRKTLTESTEKLPFVCFTQVPASFTFNRPPYGYTWNVWSAHTSDKSDTFSSNNIGLKGSTFKGVKAYSWDDNTLYINRKTVKTLQHIKALTVKDNSIVVVSLNYVTFYETDWTLVGDEYPKTAVSTVNITDEVIKGYPLQDMLTFILLKRDSTGLTYISKLTVDPSSYGVSEITLVTGELPEYSEDTTGTFDIYDYDKSFYIDNDLPYPTFYRETYQTVKGTVNPGNLITDLTVVNGVVLYVTESVEKISTLDGESRFSGEATGPDGDLITVGPFEADFPGNLGTVTQSVQKGIESLSGTVATTTKLYLLKSTGSDLKETEQSLRTFSKSIDSAYRGEDFIYGRKVESHSNTVSGSLIRFGYFVNKTVVPIINEYNNSDSLTSTIDTSYLLSETGDNTTRIINLNESLKAGSKQLFTSSYSFTSGSGTYTGPVLPYDIRDSDLKLTLQITHSCNSSLMCIVGNHKEDGTSINSFHINVSGKKNIYLKSPPLPIDYVNPPQYFASLTY